MLWLSIAVLSVIIVSSDALPAQDSAVNLRAAPMAMWRMQRILLDGTADKRDGSKLLLLEPGAVDEIGVRDIMPIISAEKRAPPAGFWGARGKRSVPDFYDYGF
ncbi:uncharacterized protein LOC129584611 [Paramacrobiotus metropolitanus]|uniref:uncharacterized protein LOC129584611 n=1 Tax=Paramacrobiotus metropolitanus TaxID=2943436 RepID=UPI002446561C|nr:uncharacterized protein LOC129584611 [Paramacrobiotus metropolitanus]